MAQRTNELLGDLAAEVFERERRLCDEGARLFPAAEDVGPRAHRLDPHCPDWIDVALDDELVAEHQAPQGDDLPAIPACRANVRVVDGASSASGGRRALRRLWLRGAHRPAFLAAWATVC